MLKRTDASPFCHARTMRRVSVWRINILPQMRKTFDRTEQRELSDSIAQKGVLNAPIVALFNREELEGYLSIINRLWKRTLTPNSFNFSKIDGQKCWYVLLAGERRTRSYREQVKKGVHRRHMQVVVHEHIVPFDAVEIQFTENNHRRVLPHEDAHAFAQYWSLLVERTGTVPRLTDFARRVGRGVEAVKAGLLFVGLPDIIRQAVMGNWGEEVPNAKLFRKERLRLPYGIAVGLAQRQAAGVPEEQLLQQMATAVINKTRVEDFREQTRKFVGNRAQSMLDLMSETAEVEAARRFRRRTVEAGVSRALIAEEIWFAKVLQLYETGLLGKEYSPFADQSVRNRLVRIAELYENIFKLMYKRPSKQALERLRSVRGLKEALIAA